MTIDAAPRPGPRAAPPPMVETPGEPERPREDRPPSVLYVTTVFPTVAWFLESEVAALDARGFRVAVAALRGVGEAVHPEHVRLRHLTRAVGSPLAWRSWRALLGWWMRRPALLTREVARILWSSRRSLYALTGHVGYLPAAAAVATIVERERFEVVHGAWAHFPATVAYLAARLTGRRFTMAAHAGADLYRTDAFLREKALAAGFVLCCVRANAARLATLAGSAARIEALPHGVDLARFDPRHAERSPEALILAGGRLGPEKGLDLAIQAMARLAARGVAARLVIVGDGPSRGALRALARRLGVADRVELTGTLSREKLDALYRRAWLFVAPCRVLANGRRDGLPNVVVEAMAMGIPCVGAAVGGMDEAILHGRTGLLCPAEDAGSLAAALERLIVSDDERRRMGAEARRLVERRFDASRSLERVAFLFRATRSSALVMRGGSWGSARPPHEQPSIHLTSGILPAR